MKHRIAGALLLSALSLPAHAGEETLELYLTTLAQSGTTLETAHGPVMEAAKVHGIAHFKDGRTAYKQYVYLGYYSDPPIRMPGFSNYDFGDGTSLQLSFMAGPAPEGFTVDYTVLSGTGAYDGATGTGKLVAVDSPWEGTMQFEGHITVITP